MYLVLTIDTEEDNWGQYAGSSFSVENTKRIPRLQHLFEKYGVYPTYLISYPVAIDSGSIEILGRCREAGLCEIGAHPHPWNTPPVEEERTSYYSYINHLPPDLQYAKIRSLHETIVSNFGVRPASYRSGRWGFNQNVAMCLARLGYRVDTSMTPYTDWGCYQGPDFSRHSHDPVLLHLASDNGEYRDILEVPPTIGYLQRNQSLSNSLYWSIKRRLPGGDRVAGLLHRTGLLNRVCLSPESHDAPQMIQLARTLMASGTQVFNLFFHSPSLLEGCSPFVTSSSELTSFLARIEMFLGFARAVGMRPVTISELGAETLGAPTVEILRL